MPKNDDSKSRGKKQAIDNGEEDDLPLRINEHTIVPGPAMQKLAYFVVKYLDAWPNWHQLLVTGRAAYKTQEDVYQAPTGQDENPWSIADEDDGAQWKWEMMVKLCPWIEDTMTYLEALKATKEFQPVFENLIQALGTKSSSCRTNDTKSVEARILHYVAVSLVPRKENGDFVDRAKLVPALDPEDNKSTTRGFRHVQIGRLVVPKSDLDEYDEDPERVAEEYLTGTRHNRPTKFFAGLYKVRTEPRKDGRTHVLNGLLQSDLLVLVFKCLFTGDRSAKIWSNTRPAGQMTFTEKCMIKAVSPQSIAYAVIHMYHAISDTSSFGDDMLSMSKPELYSIIINVFDLNVEWGQRVLDWWDRNVYLFGVLPEPAHDDDDYDDDYHQLQRDAAEMAAAEEIRLQQRRWPGRLDDDELRSQTGSQEGNDAGSRPSSRAGSILGGVDTPGRALASAVVDEEDTGALPPPASSFTARPKPSGDPLDELDDVAMDDAERFELEQDPDAEEEEPHVDAVEPGRTPVALGKKPSVSSQGGAEGSHAVADDARAGGDASTAEAQGSRKAAPATSKAGNAGTSTPKTAGKPTAPSPAKTPSQEKPGVAATLFPSQATTAVGSQEASGSSSRGKGRDKSPAKPKAKARAVARPTDRATRASGQLAKATGLRAEAPGAPAAKRASRSGEAAAKGAKRLRVEGVAGA